MTNKKETSESRSSSDSDTTGTDSQTQLKQFQHSIRLGIFEGWPVHIGVSQEPEGAPAPEEFGVNLFVPNSEGDNIDIARIDTDHAGCHMDRFYLPEGTRERTEDYTVQYETPESALRHFVQDRTWEYCVKRYKENHGLPEETRVY